VGEAGIGPGTVHGSAQQMASIKRLHSLSVAIGATKAERDL